MMPYTRQQLLAAVRADHPQFAQVDDNKLFAAVAQDHPDLAKGISELHQPEFQSPRYGPNGASPGMVASDQAANVLQGIPQAITGIPGMLQQAIPAAGQAMMGNIRPATEMAIGAVKGAAQPFVTAAQGIRALNSQYGLIRPSAVTPPTEQQWTEAAQGAGTNIGGILAGEAAGIAVPKAISAAKAAATNTAERWYESALKPGPRSNTLPEVKRMVATGLREGIPVTERGVGNLDALVDALNTKIKDTIDAGNAQGVTVNKYKVASRLSDTARNVATQVNPESGLAAVSESGNEFLRNQPSEIQAAMAQALKQGTYKQLKNTAYGELKGASVESQKALARGLKEELAAQFPEIRDMNLRESDLLQLKDELESAVNRGRNKEMFGIGTPILGGAVGGMTGSAPAGVLAGMVRSLIDRPGFKSKLAIALAHAGR